MRAFHSTIPLSLSPLYPSLSLSFPLSIPLSLSPSLPPSLSLSYLSLPLYIFPSTFLSLSFLLSLFYLSFSLASPPLSLSLSLSLYLLSLPPCLYPSFYLSISLFPSLSLLFIILFGVSNGRFRPCFLTFDRKSRLYQLHRPNKKKSGEKEREKQIINQIEIDTHLFVN